MISFDDSVTAANLPIEQPIALFYADGRYANHAEVSQRCTKAQLFGITTQTTSKASISVPALDCENGDYTVPQAEAWVIDMIALDAPLIIVYANDSTWSGNEKFSCKGELGLALEKYGDRIKRYVADYDGVAIVPALFDAKQYEGNVSDGIGNVDKNVALNDFLSPYVAPVPTGNRGKARVLLTVDVATGHCVSVRPMPGSAKYGESAPVQLSWEAQLAVGKGERYHRWRVERMPHNAAPLGG